MEGTIIGAHSRREDGEPKDFEELIIEAIDDALSVLGESAKAALLLMIKNRFHIEKHEIPKKIKEFSSALKCILGDSGRKIVERLIARSLYSKIGLGTPPEDSRELYEHIIEARKKLTHMSRHN